MGADLSNAVLRWLADREDIRFDVDKLEGLLPSLDATKSEGDDWSDLAVTPIALGAAAATGSTSAIREFERLYFSRAKGALKKMGAPPELQQEAIDETREVLFVGAPGAEPRILTLLGKGDVGSLVKVVAVRRLLNLRRFRESRSHLASQESPEEALASAISVDKTPELRALSTERRTLLRESLVAAIQDLSAENRTMLRLSVSHGFSIDDLARMYKIHRSTAARRLASTRKNLRVSVRAYLISKIGAGDSAADSVLRAATSQLELSFSKLL